MPSPDATTALYARVPSAAAAKLDRAAHELGARKRDLLAALLARYVDPDTPAGLEALRELHDERERRIVIEPAPAPLHVGRHDFRPAEPAAVLTLAEAAELLRVPEEAVRELAEAGELPGRRLGEEWRFARDALLAWLGEQTA
jgi:excisionase family DNA binding protein